MEELLSQGFINKQAYNICLKENLTTLYLINEFSKIRSFTNIHRCGYTCAILLNSLCENYREAVNALNRSINIENLITFDTTIEQLFDANRFILLTYKTCAASGCETVEDIVIKLNSHPLLKRSRVGVRKELISVCEEAKSNRLIISLKYYERTNDYICQDVLNDLVAEYHLTKESTIEELLKFNLISRRAYNCCKTAGLLNLGNIISFRDQEPNHFYSIKSCGKITVDELCRLCDQCQS